MKHYDLIVAGGGFAGTAAAIAASRRGLKVLIIERANCLGGAATVCLVQPFMKYWTSIGKELKVLSAGLFTEITKELKKMDPEIDGNSQVPGYFSEESLKIILNRMVICSGAEILFNSQITDAKCNNGRVSTVRVSAYGQNIELEADYFIDATGDANLSALCGFAFRLGRERDHLCQPMTLSFRVTGVDVDAFFDKAHREEKDPGYNRGTYRDDGYTGTQHALSQKYYKQYQQEGKIRDPREDILLYRHVIDDVIHFNTTRVIKLDPTDPFAVSKAEIEAREQVWEIFEMMKENIPAFKNAKLSATAAQIGIRESRMIDGEYRLTEEDIKSFKTFDDTIAVGNYDVDMHNPDGAGTFHFFFPAGKYYSIPYRCLIPKGAKNVLVAGRCISVDHITQASVRIMPIVCTIGEAAGCAISVAKENNSGVEEINVSALRQILRENGAVLE